MATKKTSSAKEETKVAAAPIKEEAKTVKSTSAKEETKAIKTAPAKTTKCAAKAKAVEPKIEVTLQYAGNNTAVNSVVETVKAAYAAEGNTEEIKTLEVYIQPENGVAYYVVNGNAAGKSVNL